jgi:hypothetical protein
MLLQNVVVVMKNSLSAKQQHCHMKRAETLTHLNKDGKAYDKSRFTSNHGIMNVNLTLNSIQKTAPGIYRIVSALRMTVALAVIVSKVPNPVKHLIIILLNLPAKKVDKKWFLLGSPKLVVYHVG